LESVKYGLNQPSSNRSWVYSCVSVREPHPILVTCPHESSPTAEGVSSSSSPPWKEWGEKIGRMS
jgi:hypothetical protein